MPLMSQACTRAPEIVIRFSRTISQHIHREIILNYNLFLNCAFTCKRDVIVFGTVFSYVCPLQMDEGLLPAAARTQELEKEDEDPERSTKCRRPRLRVVVMLATLLTSSSALLYLALCQCFSLSCCARRSGSGKIYAEKCSSLSACGFTRYVSVVVRRWPSVKDLNCSRLFTDKRYALAVGRKRITLKDPKQLHLNCGTVRARWLFAKRPTSREEARYPIAYARIVYKVIVCEVFFGQIDCFQDYLFLEQLLAVEYQPQNYVSASGCFCV